MLIHLIKHFFAIKTKNKQAKKMIPGLYDHFYYNKPKRNKQKKSSQVCMITFTIINRKGTSKKIIPGLHDTFYNNG